MMDDQTYIFEKMARNRTGIDPEADESILIYPFNQYRIGIKLDSEGRFLGIDKITVANTLSTMQQMQRLRSISYFDLSKKYPEEPEIVE